MIPVIYQLSIQHHLHYTPVCFPELQSKVKLLKQVLKAVDTNGYYSK